MLESRVTPLIADRLLSAASSGDSVSRAHATLDASGGIVCEFE
ncbi:hypothetical protein APX70_200382 [Pseudomonas syringae pv. maculicola]|uniref:ClpB protein n=1 Tax=Pseudomonas syringae pv. maculicola TaxID=59511 RepID=A0A3M2ZX15_PSEYM|nr:hypothetical protein APX70_200382 [Pseudomonas syringae pv. maculicola]